MEKWLGKNWKTTISGALGGVAQILLPVVQSGGTLKTEHWVTAATLLIMGLLAKDSDVTGGSR